MRINLEKSQLMGAIATVSKAISSKSTLPILEGIYLEAQDNLVTFTCSDLSLSIQTKVPATVEDEGRAVLPGRIFGEVVRRLPEGNVDLTVSPSQQAVIRCRASKTTLQTFAPEEYPALPEVADGAEVQVAQGLLKDMIRQTLFAIAVDESRPILTGALLEIESDELHMVTLDGYRLALRSGKLPADHEGLSVVVPGKSLTEMGRLLSEGEETVSLKVADGHFMMDLGHTAVISRLLEGEFIKYRQILPSDFQTTVQCEHRALLDAVERASLLAREGKNNLVKFSIAEEKLVITANSEVGEVYEEVPVALSGKALDIAFNARYFSDMLKALDDEVISLYFGTNISPCVVKPVEGEDYLYLILPVRLYNL